MSTSPTSSASAFSSLARWRMTKTADGSESLLDSTVSSQNVLDGASNGHFAAYPTAAPKTTEPMLSTTPRTRDQIRGTQNISPDRSSDDQYRGRETATPAPASTAAAEEKEKRKVVENGTLANSTNHGNAAPYFVEKEKMQSEAGGSRAANATVLRHMSVDSFSSIHAAEAAAAAAAIASQRSAKSAAVAHQWTMQSQDSTVALLPPYGSSSSRTATPMTADAEDSAALQLAFMEKERETAALAKALQTATQQFEKEMATLRRTAEADRAAREKAERDRDDLLATMAATAADDAGSPVPSRRSSSAAVSETFYNKIRERDERARARVRRDFVRQSQENLYAEEQRRAAAEKAMAEASRQAKRLEEQLKTAQEALQEANSVVEAKEVQLHERVIQVEELVGQIELLHQRLDTAAVESTREVEEALQKAAQAEALAAQRQAALEEQRNFTRELQQAVGLRGKDLQEQTAARDAVLQEARSLRLKCNMLEEKLTEAVQEATVLHEQRCATAAQELQLVTEQNSELRGRLDASESELAELRGKAAYDKTEVSQVRERLEHRVSELTVEVRSLQIQLENVTSAARRRLAFSSSSAEQERQQQAILTQKYAAESTALREELDRIKGALQQQEGKHLHDILELSQQLTTLKQEKTKLQHALNTYEHENIDATRLLAKARQELSQLQVERRRLTQSLVERRDASQVSSVMSGPDGQLHRRVMELEVVRRDLRDRLIATTEELERQSKERQMATGVLRYHQSPNRSPDAAFTSGAAFLRTGSEPLDLSRAVTINGGAAGSAAATADAHGPLPSSSASSLYDLLQQIRWQLCSILDPEGEGPYSDAAAALPSPHGRSRSRGILPTLQERRLSRGLSADERATMERLLSTCAATLHRIAIQPPDSPFYIWATRVGGGDAAAGLASVVEPLVAAPAWVDRMAVGARSPASRSSSSRGAAGGGDTVERTALTTARQKLPLHSRSLPAEAGDIVTTPPGLKDSRARQPSPPQLQLDESSYLAAAQGLQRWGQVGSEERLELESEPYWDESPRRPARSASGAGGGGHGQSASPPPPHAKQMTMQQQKKQATPPIDADTPPRRSTSSSAKLDNKARQDDAALSCSPLPRPVNMGELDASNLMPLSTGLFSNVKFSNGAAQQATASLSFPESSPASRLDEPRCMELHKSTPPHPRSRLQGRLAR